MNHELLNDEQLSIVVGGAHCDGTGGGKGNGGGDGMGRLRHLVSSIGHVLGF